MVSRIHQYLVFYVLQVFQQLEYDDANAADTRLPITDAADADAAEDLVEILDKDKGWRFYQIIQQSANYNTARLSGFSEFNFEATRSPNRAVYPSAPGGAMVVKSLLGQREELN